MGERWHRYYSSQPAMNPDDPEERHAVCEVAEITATWFNAAVVYFPGNHSQLGYPEEWETDGKAYVKGVFASWCIPVVDSETTNARVTWYRNRMSTGFILNTPDNCETIADAIISFQRVGNLFRKQLSTKHQCASHLRGFTRWYDKSWHDSGHMPLDRGRIRADNKSAKEHIGLLLPLICVAPQPETGADHIPSACQQKLLPNMKMQTMPA